MARAWDKEHYIKMHYMRTFFLCGIMTFSYYVMFIHMFIFKKNFTLLFACQRTVSMTAVYQQTIKYDQGKFGAVFLDTFDMILRLSVE